MGRIKVGDIPLSASEAYSFSLELSLWLARSITLHARYRNQMCSSSTWRMEKRNCGNQKTSLDPHESLLCTMWLYGGSSCSSTAMGRLILS